MLDAIETLAARGAWVDAHSWMQFNLSLPAPCASPGLITTSSNSRP